MLMFWGLMACTAFKPQLIPPDAQGDLPPRAAEEPGVIYLGVPCYLHEVRWPEESLATIARWYTGNSRNARILGQLTPNLRKGDLRKGDKVFVPRELARRTDPMPRSYARRYRAAIPSPGPVDSPGDPPDLDEILEGETPPSPYGPRTFPD